MRRLLTAVLMILGIAAEAAPWGYVRGGGSSTPLTATDSAGAAMLTDEMLPPTAEEVIFQSPAGGILSVSTFSLKNRTLRFSASAGGVTLRSVGKESVFLLEGGAWTFDGLAFDGSPVTEPVHYHGGAIDVAKASLVVTNCSFSNLSARFSGGAVSARLMTGDIRLVDSVFTNNCAVSPNGTGGAVYASGVRGTAPVTLTLANCRFIGNRAQNGGALTTVCTYADDETNVNLVSDGCQFADNRSEYCGGAIDADGTCEFSDTEFLDNTAGLQGGAMNLGSSSKRSVACRIYNGSIFRHNRAMNGYYWTCGGAIALWGPGNTLDIEGRHVAFDGNEVTSGDASFGGALFAASGTVSRVSYAEFNANLAENAGGAFYVWEGEAVVSTCIFSNDTVTAAEGIGGALAAETATLAVTNTTIRYANRGALTAVSTRTTLSNTLIVDNNGDADISAYGAGSQLTMNHVAYGTAEATAAIIETIVTNKCLSGVEKNVYLGDSLLLDVSTYNPVANKGSEQEGELDYRYVEYGWQKLEDEGWSIGAYQCPAPLDTPSIAIASVKWYHNRADGLYYPQITVVFIGGDATLLKSVKLTCNGTTHTLPESCVARIRTAKTIGQTFVFGVDEAHWTPSKNSSSDFGSIYGWKNATEKAEIMLFSVADKTRADVSVVGAANPIKITAIPFETLSAVPAAALASPSRLAMAVAVPAAFTEFAVGERLSGRAETSFGASVTLYGCPTLGADWQKVGTLVLAADGSFSTAIPTGLYFFRLEAEVTR